MSCGLQAAGGLGRAGARRVGAGDKRSPLRRLLEDCTHANGQVLVEYDQQWRVLWRAKELGLVDDNQFITQAGRDFVGSDRKDVRKKR